MRAFLKRQMDGYQALLDQPDALNRISWGHVRVGARRGLGVHRQLAADEPQHDQGARGHHALRRADDGAT